MNTFKWVNWRDEMFELRDVPVFKLGPLEPGMWFQLKWKLAGMESGKAFLFLAARHDTVANRYTVIYEDDGRRELRSELAGSEMDEFSSAVEHLAPRPRGIPASEKHEVQLLAEAGRFDEALASLRDLESDDRETGEYLESLGDRYAALNPTLAWWFYDTALSYLHAWGSGATSGGDGAARMLVIRPVIRKRDAIRK